jgi:Mn2+/Fe2+ NRAMP family transporter
MTEPGSLPMEATHGPPSTKQFYSVIAASTLIGMLINFAGINPMSALFWTAVINGIVSPPLLVVIMLVSNNKKVIGDKVNGVSTNIVGWVAVVVMFAATIGMFVTWGN